MKSWQIVLGRGGTVLLSVGLALLLVSFIPSIQSSTEEQLQVIGNASWQTYYIDTITPQQTLDITIATNGTIYAYLLETWPSTIYDWIIEHNPGLTDYPNVTYFDQFIGANPTLIAWKSEIHGGTASHEYVPTAVVNMTLAVSNHGPDSVNVDFQNSLRSGVAPTAKVRLLSEFAIPIGFVFTLPWLNELRAKKKRDS